MHECATAFPRNLLSKRNATLLRAVRSAPPAAGRCGSEGPPQIKARSRQRHRLELLHKQEEAPPAVASEQAGVGPTTVLGLLVASPAKSSPPNVGNYPAHIPHEPQASIPKLTVR